VDAGLIQAVTWIHKQRWLACAVRLVKNARASEAIGSQKKGTYTRARTHTHTRTHTQCYDDEGLGAWLQPIWTECGHGGCLHAAHAQLYMSWVYTQICRVGQTVYICIYIYMQYDRILINPCKKYHIYTVYIWFWPTLQMCVQASHSSIFLSVIRKLPCCAF
jgi:hypothetical protein